MVSASRGGGAGMIENNNNLAPFPKRKPISQGLRFEIFKRDAFTCQYCGRKSPDVVLHVDHIKPVADGGENDILNLITACNECNGGKGATPLDDQSVLNKQRAQLEELNERRNQLEMMIKWREGLDNLHGDYVRAIQSEFLRYGPFTANETAEKEIARWVKKYSLDELFKAINTSYTQYLRTDDDGNVTGESWTHAFNMVPRIVEVNRRGGLPDELKKVFYVRGILRRRLSYVNEREVLGLIRDAISGGMAADDVIQTAKEVRNWTEFQDIMYSWITGGEDGSNS